MVLLSMKTIDKIILYLVTACMILLLVFSCKSSKQVIQSRVDSVYIQRLVPIALPSDTARLKALLECNAQGKVVAHQLSIETTRNARLSFLLDSVGNIQVQSITEYDTIYIPSDSIRITTMLTEFVEVPAKLTNWERFILKFGTAFFWASIGLVVFGIVYLYIKIKKPF